MKLNLIYVKLIELKFGESRLNKGIAGVSVQ